MKSSAKTIGTNIRILRTEHNMTQDELAEAIFVTRQSVSNYETGRSNPDVDKLLAIAQALGTDINTLIYGLQPSPDRRADRANLVRACMTTGAMVLVYLLARCMFVLVERRYFFLAIPWRLFRGIWDPILWGSIGWTGVELIHWFFGIRPMKVDAVKRGRRILWCFVIFYVVLQLPMTCFDLYCIAQRVIYGSVHANLKIPVYNQIYAFLYPVFYQCPAIFIPFGCAFRLLRREAATTEEKTETEG